jgi:hypothetical protein
MDAKSAISEHVSPWPGPPEEQPSSSEQNRYYEYLSQAGFDNPRLLGRVKEVRGCTARVQQGAGIFNHGETKTCTYQPSEPGWVIQSVEADVTENKHGRGSYSVDVIAKEGDFNKRFKELRDKFKLATELAASQGDTEVKRKLEFERQRQLERMLSIGAAKNSAHLEVTANGGLFRTSVIEVILRVKLLKVR